MEFEFFTDADSVMQILKLWNVRLLESIPPSQPDFKTTPTITTKHSSSKERRSFRTPKAAPLVPDNDLKRAGSFSKMHTLGTGQLVAGGATLPGRRSWGGSNEIYPSPVPSGSQLSQDSVFSSLTAPPPLPPRPEESDSDDPDYSYIDENKVKGPESQRGGRSRTLSSGVSGGRVSSPTLDDQLEELKKSIMRENKKKKRDKVAHQGGRKAATLHFPPRSSPRSRLPMNFARADPEDYLEPVASKRLTSTSSEGVPRRDKLSPNIDNFPRSLSDHSGNANNSSSSSIGTAPGEVFDDNQSPPDVHTHNGSGSIGNISSVGAVVASSASGGGTVGVVGPGGNPPALPPRPWRNGSVTSVSSISSATSPSNSNVPPFTNPPPAGSRPSISEETSIIEEEKRSPVLGSPKQTRQAEQSAAVVGGNGDQVELKDGSSSPIDVGLSSVSPAPPLPPRSPTRDRDRLSRKSSSSSASSNASSSHRCPRCRSLKKTKPLVGKTASLDPRGGGGIHEAVQNLTKEENRKSLPDLNNTSPFPENNLAQNRQHHGHSSREHHHGHSCSKCSVGSSTDGFTGGAATSNGSLPASSSSQNFEYLQLLSEEGERRLQPVQQQADIDTDVSPALDLLSSCLQDLEYLENKVNRQNSNNSPPNSGSSNQLKNSNKSAAAIANEQRRMAVQTDIDAAMRQTELVQADLNMSRRNIRPVNSVGPQETRKMVANGHPPLLKKHNTISSFGGTHSSSKSPSPPAAASSGNGGSNAPLHWTQQPLAPQSTGRPGNLANGSMIRNSSSSSLISTPVNVASPLSIQSPVFSPMMSNPPSMNMGGVIGMTMGGAPPVPPRSLVSLGGEAQQLPPHVAARGHPPHGHHPSMKGRSFSQTNSRPPPEPRGLCKSNSVGRNVGSWKTAIYGDPHHHHPPQRSPSAGGMAPGMVGVGGPPPTAAFHNQNHIDSQTVFVHHLNRNGGSRQHARQMQAHLV